MKKFFAILLTITLLLTIFCAPLVMAEAAEAPAVAAPPAFTIDLTGLIIAILVAFFEFLLAWLLKAVIPPAKRWLDSHTTKNQQQILWNVVKRLVEAAEQTITGLNQGERKMAYVKAMLKANGYDVDTYLIEAAVKEMNDRVIGEIAHELDLDVEVEDEVEIEDEDLVDEEAVG